MSPTPEQQLERGVGVSNFDRYDIKVVPEHDFDQAVQIFFTLFGLDSIDQSKAFVHEQADVLFGAYLDSELVALVGLINFKMKLQNLWLDCGGIAGVASKPNHRRTGLIREVMRACMKYMHDKQFPLSSLWPFSYPFYERLGFAVTDFDYVIECPLRALPKIGDARNYREVSSYDPLKPIHERWIEQSNLSIKRDNRRWDHLVFNTAKRRVHYYLHQDGYMLLNDMYGKDNLIQVIEWAYLTPEAFADGLSLLKNFDDIRFENAGWRMLNLEDFLRTGITYPFPKINFRPRVMTRVVNLQALSQALDLEALSKVQILDPLEVTHSSGYQCVLGPGELIQELTGVWNTPSGSITDQKLAGQLHRATAARKNYTVEPF